MVERMTEGQLKMVELALEGNRYHISDLVYVDEIQAVAEETAAWVISRGKDGRCDVVRGTYMDGRWISLDVMFKSYGVDRKPIMDIIAVIPDYINNITRAERPEVTSRGISPERVNKEDIAEIKDKLTVYAQQVFNCDQPNANGRVYTKEAVAKACDEWVDKMAHGFNEAYDMTYTSANSKLVTPGPVNNVTVQGGEVELEIDTKDKEPGSVKRFLDDWARLYNDEWCKRPKGEHHIVYPAWDEILTPEARNTLEEKLGGPLHNFNFYPAFCNEEAGDPCDITITLNYESKGHMEEIIDSLPSFTDEQKEEIREDIMERWDRLGFTKGLQGPSFKFDFRMPGDMGLPRHEVVEAMVDVLTDEVNDGGSRFNTPEGRYKVVGDIIRTAAEANKSDEDKEVDNLMHRLLEDANTLAKCESERPCFVFKVNPDDVRDEAKRLTRIVIDELKESGKPYTDEDVRREVVNIMTDKLWSQHRLCKDEIVGVTPFVNHYYGPVHVKVKKLDSRAKMPFKKPGQDENFCYDIYAIDKKEIAPGTFEYRTGLAFEIEDHELKDKYILSIDARPRSSVSETGLILCNCEGTIDDPYRGEVRARFYQVKEGPEYRPYEPGDRVIQIKIGLTPRCVFHELGEDEELSETVRGKGGFGSSGRK